jgi:hypothetical protein
VPLQTVESQKNTSTSILATEHTNNFAAAVPQTPTAARPLLQRASACCCFNQPSLLPSLWQHKLLMCSLLFQCAPAAAAAAAGPANAAAASLRLFAAARAEPIGPSKIAAHKASTREWRSGGEERALHRLLSQSYSREELAMPGHAAFGLPGSARKQSNYCMDCGCRHVVTAKTSLLVTQWRMPKDMLEQFHKPKRTRLNAGMQGSGWGNINLLLHSFK